MFQNKPSVSPLPTENLANILNPTQAQPLPRELVNLKNKKTFPGETTFLTFKLANGSGWLTSRVPST